MSKIRKKLIAEGKLKTPFTKEAGKYWGKLNKGRKNFGASNCHLIPLYNFTYSNNIPSFFTWFFT